MIRTTKKMKISEYLVKELIKEGVTDAFGIPGGVILPFLYELEKSVVKPHLTYHEQTAAFAACGYAQSSGLLGVAYATRGPGIMNMLTAIAEAYQESIPVLFITAHCKRESIEGVRFSTNQEVDIVNCIKGITKYAANVENTNEAIFHIKKAIRIANEGRKGPVLIDVFSELWDREIVLSNAIEHTSDRTTKCVYSLTRVIDKHFAEAKRPIFLIGDGLRYTLPKIELVSVLNNVKIPILSSRGSLDLVSGSPYYFGYIGSHGIRYSNFILSKADLIVVIGNRMAFPRNSDSFAPILNQAKIIRIDIDEGELNNIIPGEISFCMDAKDLLNQLKEVYVRKKQSWIDVCEQIRNELINEDCLEPIQKISEFISANYTKAYICDVGNNEFWFSRAYEKTKCTSLVLMSKSFGTLGSAIGKAIGAFYALHEKIVCVVGDQGLQYNIQEFQYLAVNDLPIKILLINNNSSGMISDHERDRYGEKFIHVNKETGYITPNFKHIAEAYGIHDKLVVIDINEDIKLTPTLPKGRLCQDMEPAISRDRYDWLNKL